MTRIYYFTGTGNSLKLAKDLGKQLDGKVVSMVKALKAPEEGSPADIVGFVFPVYYYDMPAFVQQFIRKLHISKDTYVFCVATCGAKAGWAIQHVNSLLQEKGIELAFGRIVCMPDNSLTFTTAEAKKIKMFQDEDKYVTEIAEVVRMKMRLFEWGKSRRRHDLAAAFLKWGMNKTYGMKKKEAIDTQCNRCGICAKICPVGNISEDAGSYHWGKNCEECFACIHWCPQKAVHFGRIGLKKRPAYHHPQISLKEILNQKGSENCVE